MKQYLNRSEKDQVLTLSAFIDYAEKTADKWANMVYNKNAVKFLRMAKSFITKSLSIKCDGLNDFERDNLINQSEKMDVVLKYSNDAIRAYKQMLELDSVTPIQTSDLLDLCEKALEACDNCSESPSTCKTMKLFIKYDIPVYTDSPGRGKCPYSTKEDSDEKIA